MSELRFEDVTVQYGRGRAARTVIDAVSLTVPSGTTVGLVGESGCGKSTLGKTAVRLVDPAAGRVTAGGRDIRSFRGRNRPVHMVFQDPYASLDPRMTVGATISEAMPRDIRGRARIAEIDRLLELVHLDPGYRDVLPRQMSGGQRQRVALARALAARPEFVIADEMTSALDVSVQASMLNLLRELQKNLGLGILFISHDLAVVRYTCDRVAVLLEGRIVEQSDTLDMIDAPRHPYTAALLRAAGHQRTLQNQEKLTNA